MLVRRLTRLFGSRNEPNRRVNRLTNLGQARGRIERVLAKACEKGSHGRNFLCCKVLQAQRMARLMVAHTSHSLAFSGIGDNAWPVHVDISSWQL